MAAASLAQDRGTIIQIQNAGTTIGTFVKYLRLNCDAGSTCTLSSGTVNITAAAGAAPRIDQVTDPTANKSFDMTTRTLNFNFTGDWGAGFGYRLVWCPAELLPERSRTLSFKRFSDHISAHHRNLSRLHSAARSNLLMRTTRLCSLGILSPDRSYRE
jgi:hypothetical protein